MKKTILFLVLSICTLHTFAQKKEKAPKKEVVKAIKPITDFRDIYWGSPIDSTIRNNEKIEFKVEKELNGEKYCTITDDDLTIGSVTLKSIQYIFDANGRFSRVLLTGDKKDVAQMSFILEYKYGKHLNDDKFDEVEYFEWLVKGVKVQLAEYSLAKFEVNISSNLEAAENYKKNISVDDF